MRSPTVRAYCPRTHYMAKVQNQQINKQKTPVILKLITTITFNCIAQTKEEEEIKGRIQEKDNAKNG